MKIFAKDTTFTTSLPQRLMEQRRLRISRNLLFIVHVHCIFMCSARSKFLYPITHYVCSSGLVAEMFISNSVTSNSIEIYLFIYVNTMVPIYISEDQYTFAFSNNFFHSDEATPIHELWTLQAAFSYFENRWPLILCKERKRSIWCQIRTVRRMTHQFKVLAVQKVGCLCWSVWA